MLRVFTTLLLCAAAQAATLTVNLSVNATVAASASGYTATGTATLTGGITDSGTFSATIPLSELESSSAVVPYSLTLKQGTLAGNLTLPLATILSTGSGAGSATVTSALGSYSGDTGSFPSLSGTGGISSTGITLGFTGSGTITTGGTVSAPPPTITAVLDAASYTANIAQGSIFVVKGSNLSASGYTSLSYPLPTSSTATGGTSITFTPASGASTGAYLIYTYLENGVNQLAAILPSTVAPGAYNVTVTYAGSTSTGFAAQVVASKPGIITQDSTGNGLAAAQVLPSYNLIRLTTGTVAGTAIEPAHPGDTVVVYGTGLGPVPFADNNPVPNAGYTFSNVQAIVGGTTITPLYAGRTPGASGLDQIAFTLPSNITTGCAVTLQIMEGNGTSSATTLSIAPSSSATACVYPGLTTAQLENLDQGGTFTTGAFEIIQSTEAVSGTNETDSLASGSFSQLTGFELSSATSSSVVAVPGNYTTTTIGACTVYQFTSTGTGSGTGTVLAGGVSTTLDAGTVTLNGPSGSNITNEALTETNNIYSKTLGESGFTGLQNPPNGVIVAGTYTLAGAGGKDVGAFNTSLTLAPLTVTGALPATVTESAGVTINWTGGNAPDVVEIFGVSSSTTGSGSTAVTTTAEFLCQTTAGEGTFTVAPSVLTLLPKVSTSAVSAGTGSGSLGVYTEPAAATFTAPLTAGGTVASTFSALTTTGAVVSYQ